MPGISLINQRNNTRIKGSTNIQLQISAGNGTVFYRWDGGDNKTINEGTDISIPNPEIESSHTLEVYVRGITGLWAHSSFTWIVDNSPPQLTYRIENNSIIKGVVKVPVFSTEDINLTYRLISQETNRSVLIDAGQNYTISYSNLENGTYQLIIVATDEARNTATTTLLFSVYISAFNWNWGLEAETPRTIKIINATSDLWFILTLTSAVDQSFNLTVLSEDLYPEKNNMLEYVIQFNCEQPNEIIFVSLTLQLSLNTSVLPVYQWVYWDTQEGWVNITSSYNEVSNSWEATHTGFVPYFALLNPGVKTTLTSITPGGGHIPSFEIVPAIFALVMITVLVYSKRRLKKSRSELR